MHDQCFMFSQFNFKFTSVITSEFFWQNFVFCIVALCSLASVNSSTPFLLLKFQKREWEWGGLKFRQINRSTRPSIGGERYSSLTLPYLTCVTLSPPLPLFKPLKFFLWQSSSSETLLFPFSFFHHNFWIVSTLPTNPTWDFGLFRCVRHTEQNRTATQTSKNSSRKIFTLFFVCTLAPKSTFEITDLSGL